MSIPNLGFALEIFVVVLRLTTTVVVQLFYNVMAAILFMLVHSDISDLLVISVDPIVTTNF